MVEKTVFILWGWYEGANPLDQKLLGVYCTEDEATTHMRGASPNITAFVCYEGRIGKPWQASLPGEIPNKIFFVHREAYDGWTPINMIELRSILGKQRQEQ